MRANIRQLHLFSFLWAPPLTTGFVGCHLVSTPDSTPAGAGLSHNLLGPSLPVKVVAKTDTSLVSRGSCKTPVRRWVWRPFAHSTGQRVLGLTHRLLQGGQYGACATVFPFLLGSLLISQISTPKANDKAKTWNNRHQLITLLGAPSLRPGSLWEGRMVT